MIMIMVSSAEASTGRFHWHVRVPGGPGPPRPGARRGPPAGHCGTVTVRASEAEGRGRRQKNFPFWKAILLIRITHNGRVTADSDPRWAGVHRNWTSEALSSRRASVIPRESPPLWIVLIEGSPDPTGSASVERRAATSDKLNVTIMSHHTTSD